MMLRLILIVICFSFTVGFGQSKKYSGNDEEILNQIYKECVGIDYKYIYINKYMPFSFFNGYVNPNHYNNQIRDDVYTKWADSTLLDKFPVKIPKEKIDSLSALKRFVDERKIDRFSLIGTWDQEKLVSKIKINDNSSGLTNIKYPWGVEEEKKWGDEKTLKKYQEYDIAYKKIPLYKRSIFTFSRPFLFKSDSDSYLLIQVEHKAYDYYSKKVFLFKSKDGVWAKVKMIGLQY
jgi:hypothetical protein